MRDNGMDKLALLVACCMTALVVLAAAGTGPAFSEDQPVRVTASSQVARGAVEDAASSSRSQLPEPTEPDARDAQPLTDVRIQSDAPLDGDGYEWSGSRPPAQRYLWSHRAS